MESYIIPIVLGLFIVVLGICNLRGNINAIHWYHRQRVAEENKKAFGKLMGIGTITCGTSIIVYGLLLLLTELTKQPIFTLIGAVLIAVGIFAGIGISFYAMIKYNKGIF